MQGKWKNRLFSTNAVRNTIYLLLLVLFSFWSLLPTAVAGENARPEQIILTWTGDPDSSQTISWLMPGGSPAQVQYIEANVFNGSFNSARQVNITGIAFDSIYYRYTATITGLTPDTEYIYRVGREGCWSDNLSFTTATNTGKFSFLYMGDVQSGYAEWGSMLNSVYQAYPHIKFSLLGGDLTSYSNNENEWGQFLDAAANIFSRIPLMPTMGNHDGAMYLKFFALPPNGPPNLQSEFYSFDYGNAHFVILNSNKNTNLTAKQWLQQDLQASSKTWKFAVFHHPAYQAYPDNKGIDQSIRDNWVPILEQNGVDMVFVGHQHEYMRTYPIYQNKVQTGPADYGIVYVMGNAGTKVYAPGPGFDYIAKEVSCSNYQLINIDGNVLTLISKKADGELIDSYTIKKSSGSAPTLIPDHNDNCPGQAIEITYTDNPDWRSAITEVSVDGVPIYGKYNISEGKIIIYADVFDQTRDYLITITARNYQDATIRQTMVNLFSDWPDESVFTTYDRNIEFSLPVSKTQTLGDHIYVTDIMGRRLDVTCIILEDNQKKVQVLSSKGIYQPGASYTLWIKDSLQADGGIKTLKTPYKMQFKISEKE